MHTGEVGEHICGFLRIVMSMKTRAMSNREREILLEGQAQPEDGDSADTVIEDDQVNRIREKELDVQALQLQLELEKLKLQSRSLGETGAREGRHRVGEYASELRAVLAPMPEFDAMVPAWFKNVDVLFASLDIPSAVQGSVILPFLNERARSFVASQSHGEILAYPSLKDLILKELRLTANEYKRLFWVSHKSESESWNQFTTKLETLFEYYVTSRRVSTLDELKELMVSDRLKRAMSEELRGYVLQNETQGWLRPRDVARLAENFEESQRTWSGSRGSRFQNNGDVTARMRRGGTAPNDNRRLEGYRNDRCYECGRFGHMQRSCPDLHRGRGDDPRHRRRGPNALVARVSDMSQLARGCEGAQWVDVSINGSGVLARVDSGADITVVRAGSVLNQEPGAGCITLKGAFGSVVSATLQYICIGLRRNNGELGRPVRLLCAVTDKLAGDVGALITPADYAAICKVDDELSSEVEEVLNIQAEMGPVDGDTVDKGDKLGSAVEFERDDEQDAETNVVTVNVDRARGDTETARTFRQEQREDVTLHDGWSEAESGTHGMLVDDDLLFHETEIGGRRVRQLVLPIGRRAEVMRLAHDVPGGGHFAEKKTKMRIRSAFYWPTMGGDIKKYCSSCETCQIFAPSRTKDRVPITPLTRPESPFQVVYMDCIGPIEVPSARGHRYALCVVDLCTRWAEVIPLRALTAKATCQALLDIFSHYGAPEVICSDQGSNFTAQLTQAFNERLGVRMRFSTPEHPQSNGLVERFNGTFKAMLKHVICSNQRQWDLYIPCILWAYRETPHDVTGYSPFELMYGRAPHGPLAILRKFWTGEWSPPDGLNTSATQYLNDLRKRMAESWQIAQEHSNEVQRRYVTRYNLRATEKYFHDGDSVLVLETGMMGKMRPKWSGPATVKSKCRDNSYVVKFTDGTERWVHANRLKHYVARVDQVSVIFEDDREFGNVEHMPVKRDDGGRAPEIENIDGRLNQGQEQELRRLLDEVKECFSENPGRCMIGSHKITLCPDSKLDSRKPYRVPVALREEVDKQVDQLLGWGFIFPVESNCAHPIVCVAKKDGTIRMCVDYRRLNAITEPDRYPMGDCTELLYSVARAKFITTLDMTRGYWQIAMDPKAQKLTAFATPRGLYAWRVMPFGLRNSAATFQRIMNEILRGHRGYAVAYIDDVAVYSDTWDQHIRHLTSVLESIRGAGLKVNPRKCKFAQSQVKYLGHIVGSGRHAPDPERVNTIRELQLPKTKTELRRVLGMFNYYREYIDHFADKVVKLTDLTKRNVPAVTPWEQGSRDAFESIKIALASVAELAAPDVHGQYCLTTDASELAVGACFSQRTEGMDKPIAFLSKRLTPAQVKWAVVEREAYAIIWALGKLDTWVFGRVVTVRTDHNPLVYLYRSASSSARLTRWALALQKYELEIEYIRGDANRVADALSR